MPDDVLVQRLTGPDAEEEPAFEQQRVVAAAWATTAGCIRMIGHDTPTPTAIGSVDAAMAPSTLHTNGLWPCALTHG